MSYNVDNYRTQMYRFDDRTLVCPPGSIPHASGVGCRPVFVPDDPIWRQSPQLQGLGGCGCASLRPAGGAGMDGLGDPMLCASSGAMVVDAGIGAAVGYFLAPEDKDKAAWAAGGGAAGALGGLLGIGIVAAIAIYLRAKR